MSRILASLLITLIATSANGADTPALPRLGAVTVIDPGRTPSGVVILFSDPAAADPIPERSLNALAEAGQAVAVVDSGGYLARLDRAGGDCSRAAADVTGLKAMLLRRYGLPDDTSAVLAGPGAGGALAYAVLAQCPDGQFFGAVSFEFNPNLPGRRPLCPGAPYAPTPGGFRYFPVERLGGFWRIATASPDGAQLRPYRQGRPDVVFPLRPYDDLASAIISVIADAGHAAASNGDTIDVLPLVLLPTDRHSATMAVIYSGDGGWRDLDKQIGEALQTAGIPVVGVDALRLFWHRRTPEAASADLARVIDHFTDTWKAPDVLLIGYSFGADVIPFMVNRLTPRTRSRIRLIALLGLSRSADFEIRVSGWLGSSSADALPLAPELGKLDRLKVQCFVGEEERAESGCVDASLSGAEIIETAGGHHFDGDYGKIARTIIDGALQRGARLPSGAKP